MNQYQLTQYGLPGLSDMGTLRLPVANAPVAEGWLTGQGARLISSSPVREGADQVIRFEDPGYQSLISRLHDKAGMGNNREYYEVSGDSDRFFEIDPQSYEALHKIKAQGVPADYIDKFAAAPQKTYDRNTVRYTPEHYDRLRGAFSRMKIPVEVVDPQYVKQTWADYSDEASQLDYPMESSYDPKWAIDPTEGKKGTIFLPRRDVPIETASPAYSKSLVDVLTDEMVRGGDYFIDNGYSSQVVPGTQAKGYAGEAGQAIKDTHKAVTNYALNRQLLGNDQRMLAQAFENSRGTMAAANPNYAQYIVQPEFRNQLRNAGKFAGSVLGLAG